MTEELNLLNSDHHPVYKEGDFLSLDDFNLWKSRRCNSIKRKIKAFEKIQPFSGKLKIGIIDAKELGGSLYSPDPSHCNIFCVVKVGTNSQKTNVRKGSWNPQFGDTFNFEVSAIDTRIKIEVWDKKLIGSSFLGCVVTNPEELMWENMPVEKWYTLTSRPRSNDTGISGSIQLKINLSFRLGPAKRQDSDSDEEEPNKISKFFSKEEEIKPKKKKIEKLGVFNYAEYYRYLLMIILLESCEQETRKLEERPGISFKRSQRTLKDIPVEVVSGSPSKHIRNTSDVIQSSSSSPTFLNMAQLSLRKAGTLRNNDRGDPVKPLPEFQWILDSFLNRYSIPHSFSNLVLLEVLVSSFSLSRDHLTMIHFSLMELEAEKCTESFLLKRESQLYEKYVHTELRNNLDESLSNYFLKFPDNKPDGALSIVIVLYALLYPDSDRFCNSLSEKTEHAMIKMYKAVVGDRPSEESLIDACKFISAVIDKDEEFFSNVFPPEIKHTRHAVNIYYSEMLSKNIKSLLRTNPPISENIMSLYTQLKKLNQKVYKFNPEIEIMPLSQMFQPFVSKWIDRIGDQLPSWCNSVLKEEKWKALSSDDLNPVLHTVSVQELFDIIYELYTTYKDFEMRASKDLKNLQKIIEKTIDTYIDVILSRLSEAYHPKAESISMHEKNDDQTSLAGKSKNVYGCYKITNECCTWLMNLEVITLRLYEFCTNVVNDGEKGGEELKQQFGELFSRLKQAQDQVTDYIIHQFNQNPSLESSLDTFIGNPPDNINKVSNNDILARMDSLFQYINSSVKTLCENLDFKVCLKVIEQLYQILVRDIEAYLYPSTPGKKTDIKAMAIVERAYPFLIEFFFADGDAIPVQNLEKASETLKSAFDMLKLPTPSLIKIYTDLENGLKPHGSNYVNLDPINMELEIVYILHSRKGDKEAKKFAKLHKDTTVSRSIIKSFGLPSTENLIEWFTCKKGKKQNIPGYLYITTNYICFDTYLSTGHQVKVRIKDLKHVKRKRGSMSTITLVLKVGLQYVLHSINKTKAYDIIDSQAEAIGTPLEKIEPDEKGKKSNTDSATKTEARTKNGGVVETKDSVVKQKKGTPKKKKKSSSTELKE